MRKQATHKMILVTACLVFALSLASTVAAEETTEGDPGGNYLNSADTQSSNSTLVDPQILVIGSSTAVKSYNEVAKTLMNETNSEYPGLVKFQIRSTSQIGNMTAEELKNLINSSDIILAEWGTQLKTNGFESVIVNNPEIIQNKLFFVFESEPSLLKLCRINGTQVFTGVTDSDLGAYNKPGTLIGACHDGDVDTLLSYKQKYPLNTALHDWIDCAVYFAGGGSENLENQFKWALQKFTEIKGAIWPSKWAPKPVEKGAILSQEFLYRDGQRYTKEQYFAKYPLDSSKPTVAVLTYVGSTGEVTYEAAFQQIIDKLVSKGMNVIPVVGTWSASLKLNDTAILDLAKTLCSEGQTVNITAKKGIGNYTEDEKNDICGVVSDTTAIIYEIDILDSQGNKVKNVKISQLQPANIYSAMVKFLTDAKNVVQYEADPKKYPVNAHVMIDLLTFTTGSTTSSVQVNRFFDYSDIPVLKAMITSSTYRTEGQWMVSDEGFSWVSVYWQMAQPEMQGMIEPIAIGVGEIGKDSETGAQWDITVSIPERIEKLTDRAYNWCLLSKLPNIAKKIAMVYYNYPPGKQNIGASYLNVPESIVEILKRLKNEGYNVGEIPDNADALISLMLERGINVANWAPGELEALANNPNTILWPVEEYEKWFKTLDPIAQKEMVEGPSGYIEELTKLAVEYIKKGDPRVKDEMIKSLDKWAQEMVSNANTYPEKSASAILQINKMRDALKTVLENVSANQDPTSAWNSFYEAKNAFRTLNMSGMTGWGELPGNVMTVTKNGKQYIVIPGMLFGNLFIGPEPQRGWEADASNFYHSTIVPPPHCYLAWYAWVNTVYKANAQVHIGRHATYEWTPRKQYALADFDYPDICIANTPSIYIYIMDGVGEGLQAKRRGLAVMIDHLTPPMMTTHLYGGLQELSGLVDNYERTPDGNPMKQEYATKIKEKVIELHLGTDIGLNDPQNITDADIDKIHDYLLSLEQTLMPYGLSTFGKPWSLNETALLVASMLSPDSSKDPSLQRLISKLNGWDFDNLTLGQAEIVNDQAIEMIKDLLSGNSIDDIIQNINDQSLKASLRTKLETALVYGKNINDSFTSEMDALVEALSGHYITPAKGGDPVKAPYALPTGKNFYAQDDNTLPTSTAWDLGKRLADMALAQLDTIPQKIAAVVWCVETARDDGTMVSFVLRMLGVQPKLDDKTWLGGGKLSNIIPTPLTELLTDLNKVRASMGLTPLTERPRIDVVTTTSGLFRDLFPNLASKMDVSYRVALVSSYSTILEKYPELEVELKKAIDPLITGKYPQAKTLDLLLKAYDLKDPISKNYVASDWISLVKSGYDGDTAITRIFAPPVGDYGAGVNHGVEEAWTWDNREELADVYLRRMSHSYSNTGWGVSNQKLFEDLLKGINVAYHSRSTNLYGVIDNDDYYDYFGGLSMAIEKVNNGKAPALNVLYYANPANPQVMSLQQFMAQEMRSRYYNPEWIKGMMNEGYSGARYISNKFVSYLWGWQVTTPHLVHDWMWDEVTNTYIKDQYNLGVNNWLSSGNRVFAMISITGTLLTAAHKGYWQADQATLNLVANKWAQLIAAHGVACCDCSCGNIAMIEWASQYVNPDILSKLNAQLYKATGNPGFAPSPTPSQPQSEASSAPQSAGSTSRSSSQSSGVAGEVGEQSQSQESTTPGDQGQAKAYEVSQQGNSGTSDSGLPAAAIIGVIVLVGLIGFGYFRVR
ncbi:MAG: cobaltochelatase subunit CobN [Methanobacteriaceae archaeon]|nr:cobaltochelatase subunit CobN [Methanobacteriaceae archaeon]